MRARRYALRLIVAFVTFYAGWAAAVLFSPARVEEPRVLQMRYRSRYVAPPAPFEFTPHGPCGGGRDGARHAFEWREYRHPHGLDLPPPPPPAAPPPAR